MKNILIEPIILLCSERSGSNLITKIFDAHQSLCSGREPFIWVSHEFNAKTKLDKRQTVNAIIKLFRAKIAHWQIDELMTLRLGPLCWIVQAVNRCVLCYITWNA